MRDGYKKTEIGVIPEDWEVKKLEDICEFLDGRRKPIKAFDRENMKGDIPYYGASGIIDWINDYIFDEDIILLGEDGENLKSRNVPLAFKVTGKCWVNNHAHVLKPKKDNIDFVTEILESKDYTPYVIGSAQPKLTQAECRKIKIQVPPLKEQEKIAEILSTVDSQIDDTEKLIEKSKELKKGLMQKLLTKGIGHSEFKKTEVGEIPVSWEVKKLGDIGDAIIGLTYSPDDLVEDNKNGILVLRSSNIKENNIVFDDNKYVNKNIPEKLITKNGDILICSRNGSKSLIGKSAYIDFRSEGNSFGAFMTIYRSKYNKFLIHIFNSYIIKRQICNNLGATINQITTSNLKSFKVPFPPIEEQTKIGEILYEFDIKIEAYQNKKQQLENLKKGLMQQLLIGNIRV